MRALSSLALGVLAMALTVTGAANAAENSGAVYAVTYFEAAAPDVSKVAADASQFATASRQQAGNAGFAAFQEIGRPSRFAMFEGWHDKAALDAHNSAATTTAFRDKLQPLLVGPFEIREHSGFSLAAPGGPGGRDAVYVVTHVGCLSRRQGPGRSTGHRARGGRA